MPSLPSSPGGPQPFLPRYEVVSPLGEGGVGTVYKVRDLEEGSIKALKALKQTRSQSSRNIEQFEDEYRILRSLRHPSLPEVFDFGVTAEATRYMVMEFVEGRSLDRYHGTHQEETWILLYQLGEALAFIHQHGLLHLDLKPSNVLVTRTRAYGGDEKPLVKLLDFGVSYRRDTERKIATVGTPGYIAPEMIRGNEPVTRAADYYSCGATLYQLVEGRLPFDGSVDEVLHAHQFEEIRFRTSKAEYADLYPRIKLLMDKDPMKRLEAFDDFRSAMTLRAAADLEPLQKAYAIGHIDSFGLVGKKDLWDRLGQWVDAITVALVERKRVQGLYDSAYFGPEGEGQQEMAGEASMAEDYFSRTRGTSAVGGQLEVPVALDTEALTRTTLKLEQYIAEHMKEASPEDQEEKEQAAKKVKEPLARTILISGAGGAGKSFVTNALKAEFQLRGAGVAILGEGGDYEALVSTRGVAGAAVEAIDPQSIIIDRFVQGWDNLIERGKQQGMVLIVDGFERLRKEVKEFLAYVSTRCEVMIDEGTEPGVFIVVTGKSPQLKKEIRGLLPHRQAEELVIPPPTSDDLADILERFHGHMPGVEDRRRLKDYLARNGQSSGALLARLKESVLRGDLVLTGGKWRFTWTPTKTRKRDLPQEDYYQLLLDGLSGGEKEVLHWLSCHRGDLFVHELLGLTAMENWELRDALQTIRPYRVVEVTKDREGERIRLVSEAVREGFYEGISRQERESLHRQYLEYFADKHIDPERSHKLLLYHYEQVGDSKQALKTRVRVIKEMKHAKDIFGIREYCDAGIAFIKRLEADKRGRLSWGLERYFIKQWVEAEWMANSNRAVVDVVRSHIVGRGREIPLSFCYKYGTALERSGEIKACKEFIAATKRRIRNKFSETYARLLLLEASVLHATGAYESSVKVLARINKDSAVLDSFTLASIYIVYMLNYECLGNKDLYDRYLSVGEDIADQNGHYELSLTASYSKILSFLNNSQYEKARVALRDSIRLATKHRVYRRLCSMYFLASAVYYEEGNYKKALKHLDKAISIALNMGMIELMNDLMLRYALIYQNLGYYENAIHIAETVKNQVSREYRSEQYFYSLLVLFDLHISLKNEKAALLRTELERLKPNIEAKYRLALYHLLSGDYYYHQTLYREARQEYTNARSLYEAIEYVDDVARCTIRMAHTLVQQKRYRKAEQILERMESKIKRMESKDLRAEFYMAHLALCCERGGDTRQLLQYLEICEEARVLISDINILMRMNALLFRANLKLGELARAVIFFKYYHAQVREITGNLPNRDYITQFVKSREFQALVEEFRQIAKKYPNQPVH
ncbi:MAG: protein kinase [Candidatus Krumholzibacteria bacterium]